MYTIKRQIGRKVLWSSWDVDFETALDMMLDLSIDDESPLLLVKGEGMDRQELAMAVHGRLLWVVDSGYIAA